MIRYRQLRYRQLRYRQLRYRQLRYCQLRYRQLRYCQLRYRQLQHLVQSLFRTVCDIFSVILLVSVSYTGMQIPNIAIKAL